MAAEPSLALLEVRAHLDLPFELLPDDYVYLAIELGELEVTDMALPKDPRDCRRLGDEWLAARTTPLLRVPSVIVPMARNILLNPRHPDAVLVDVSATYPCDFDQRLWSLGR